MRTFNLKSKMALAVSALFLLSLGIFFGVAQSYYEREFKRSISSQQDALVTSIATSLDNKLRFNRELLVKTAELLDLRDIGSADRAQRFLDERVSARLTFDNGLFLFSPTGRIIAESPFVPGPGRRGKDISFREYYRQTVQFRKPYISAPYVSTHSPGHPALMITAPVFDGGGRLVAILGGSIDLAGNNFIEKLRDFRIGRSGYVFLFNSRRTMIMHPDAKLIMRNGEPPGSNPMFDRAIDGFDGSGETVDSRGLHVIASFRHLRNTEWIVGASYPVAEAYAPLQRARRYFFSALVAGAALVMVLVWLMMKRLTQPLATFARHVNGISAKRGDERLIALNRRDEIGVLARSFNAMMEELDRRQQAIVESEVKYRGLFQAVPDAVIIGNLATGAITEVNEAACEMYGYTREEFRRVSPDDICTDTEGPAAVFARRDRHLHNRTHRRKDGTHIPVDVSLNYVTYGAQPSFIAAVRDVSARIEAEEAIRTLNTDLERRVSERTDELNASNRELEAFCYSVSHDLRAPLRSICGFSNLIREEFGERLDDDGRAYLARIDAASQRMGDLIDDLLNLSRVSRGEMRHEQVDLSGMAAEVLFELARPKRDRKVTTTIMPGIMATGDSQLFRVLLQNLLGNAWKFTSRTPHACIEFGCIRDGDIPVYYVCDNGAGFDMAYAANMFEPFQRLHRNDEFAGTGIGLATVQRVVQRHGGRVWGEGAPGRGARFSFTLGAPPLSGG